MFFSCHTARSGNRLLYPLALSAFPWVSRLSGIEGEAERKPMFALELDRGLFKFTLNTPALDVLFQLPPQIGKRNSRFPLSLLIPRPDYFFLPLFLSASITALIHPPVMLPISSRRSLITPYWWNVSSFRRYA